MAILNKEDFMSRINEIVGDSTEENMLNFMADMSDTYNDMESRLGDGVDWKSKYNTLANQYKERFMHGNPTPDPHEDDDDETPEKTKFSELFTRKEGK